MDKLNGTPNRALIATTLGFFFFVGFVAVSLFGPTAKLLKVPMELSPVQVKLLVAMPMLSGSLARIPFLRLGRYKRRQETLSVASQHLAG